MVNKLDCKFMTRKISRKSLAKVPSFFRNQINFMKVYVKALQREVISSSMQTAAVQKPKQCPVCKRYNRSSDILEK